MWGIFWYPRLPPKRHESNSCIPSTSPTLALANAERAWRRIRHQVRDDRRTARSHSSRRVARATMFSSENTGSSVRGPDGAEVRRHTSSSTVPRNLSARVMEATSCCRVGFGGKKSCRDSKVDDGLAIELMASSERFSERTKAWPKDVPQYRSHIE